MRWKMVVIILLLFGAVNHTQAHESAYQLAQYRIEEAQIRQSRHLDLGWLELEVLPPEIWTLTHLEALIIPGNKLQELPPEIGNLTQLNTL
jgi:Leucine-rich repeat (LRR) protein